MSVHEVGTRTFPRQTGKGSAEAGAVLRRPWAWSHLILAASSYNPKSPPFRLTLNVPTSTLGNLPVPLLLPTMWLPGRKLAVGSPILITPMLPLGTVTHMCHDVVPATLSTGGKGIV